MTYTITQQCIGCQRCLSACPTGAIQTNGTTVWIESDRCNQCQTTHNVAQCWAICPTNEGCVPIAQPLLQSLSSTPSDYWSSWFTHYSQAVARLNNREQSQYWRQWFDAYSQRVSQLQA